MTRNLDTFLSDFQPLFQSVISGDRSSLLQLKLLCTQSEQYYIYAKCLLERLKEAQLNDRYVGYLIKSVTEEIDDQIRTMDDQCLKDILSYSEGQNAIEIGQWIENVMTSSHVASGDIVKIHRAYRMASAPPVEYLRQSVFLNALLLDIFVKKTVNQMDEKLWILALAVSHNDLCTIHENRNNLEETLARLKGLYAIVSQITIVTELKDQFKDLVQALKCPITAQGLMVWLEHFFRDAEFFDNNELSECAPVFDLFNEIAIRKPLQRSLLLDTYGRMYQQSWPGVLPAMSLDIKKQILELFLFLMKLGHVQQVFENFPTETDSELLVYFMEQIFKVFEQPFPTAVKEFLKKAAEKTELSVELAQQVQDLV